MIESFFEKNDSIIFCLEISSYGISEKSSYFALQYHLAMCSETCNIYV